MPRERSLHVDRRSYLKAAGAAGLTGMAGCTGFLDDEEMELTMGSELPGSHIMSEVAEEFADDFNEQADNTNIEVLYGGALGADEAVAELTAEGEVELAYGSAAFWFYAPTYNFIAHPYLFTSMGEVDAFMESEYGEALQDTVREEGNQEMVGVHILGVRDVYATEPLETPEDGEGLTLRTPGIESFQELIGEALNVDTEVLPSGETYTSIETGVVDGMEAEAFTGRALSLYEVCDYISHTGHCIGPGAYYVNNDILEEMDDDDSELLMDLYEQHIEDNKQRAWDAAEEELEYMEEEEGIERIDVDWDPFLERAEPLLREMFDTGVWSDAGTSYDEIRDITS